MILPNTVIIGAPKSGTSSLFFWLNAHPEVCGSRVKETFYFHDRVHPRFNKNANFIKHGLSKYPDFWSHYAQEKIILEATAQYIFLNNPMVELSKFPSPPKIIILLREQSSRIYSLFKFNKYRLGQVEKNVSFETYIGERNNNVLEANPLAQSNYLEVIKRWDEKFGKENILVYQFEKMQKDKVSFMKQVALDLAIDESFYNNFDFFKRNETRSMKNHKLHRLGLKIQPYVPQWLQEKIFVPFYLAINSSKAPAITADEKEYLQRLKNEFKSSNKQLAAIYPQIDLELWK